MPNDDKTEQPTAEKRKESRKKGQVAKSHEMSAAISLLSGLLIIKSSMPMISAQLSMLLTRHLGNLSAFEGTTAGVSALFNSSAMVFAKIMAPILGCVLLTGLVSNVAQVGMFFNMQSVMPDLAKLDPMKGMTRMVSPKSLVELGKSGLKMGIVGYVVYAFMRNEQAAMVSLGMVDRAAAGHIVADLIWRLCMKATSVLLVIACLDYGYQKFQHEKSLKMTKQEVKDEYKRSEGDPHVKAQFRQRHRQMSSKRMMQDVPKADVIVTNPTHFAVALRYDPKTMAAPVVLAKGQDFVAQKIKEIAKEHRIPVVENKPVARALFAQAEIGDPVPVELYQAVAEILALVYRLKKGIQAR